MKLLKNLMAISLVACLVAGTAIADCAPITQNGSAACTSLVGIQYAGTTEVSLNEQFTSKMIVTPNQDVAEVVIKSTVPEGLTYVSSTPAAQVNGTSLTWNLGDLDAFQCQTLEITWQANQEGTFKQCAYVSAFPRTCFVVTATNPRIEVTKTAPETALVGQPFPYTVTVKNVGSGLAKNVVVTDTLPEGISLVSDPSARTFTMNAGDMIPGCVKTATFDAVAAQRGTYCNNVTAKGDNTNQADAQACTKVLQPEFEIYKTGTPEQLVNKKANYVITVKNTGDTTFENVVVTDVPGANLTILAANGSNGQLSSPSWTIPTLNPGQQVEFSVVATSPVVGETTNCATINVNGVEKQACANTKWYGQAALLIEMVDNPDPIQLDAEPAEQVTYTITVTNQGSADDTSITMKVVFPAEVTPVACGGATNGTVNGKEVTFETVPVLTPKQAVTWTITAKGEAVGDARIKAFLNSDLLKNPVVEEESTHVY
ncbi:DUF11 domain-containing protein [bacterium]|nr:DUF11 domain-containing protein [bacterium]